MSEGDGKQAGDDAAPLSAVPSATLSSPSEFKAKSFADRYLKYLESHAQIQLVHNNLPLGYYYKTAAGLKSQADVYIAEGDDENSYIFLLRFANFYVHTISAHEKYNSKAFASEKVKWRKLAFSAMDQLEALKAKLRAKCEAMAMDTSENSSAATTTIAAAASTDSAASTNGADSTSTPSAPPQPVRQVSWDNLRVPASALAPRPVRPAAATAPRPPATYPPLAKGSSPPPPPPPKPSAFEHATWNLRNVRCSMAVLQQFQEVAAPNTARDIETCGILTGYLKQNEFFVTTVVIPKQEGTANTVHTHSEEELFELQEQKGLLTLGWIHTHPSQSCFLSSVDLHTHFSYQIMLAEAIAIVVAPTANPVSGVFSLTSQGMDVLGSCDRRGFHRHEENEGLYGLAAHFKYVEDATCPISFVDMRGGASVAGASH